MEIRSAVQRVPSSSLLWLMTAGGFFSFFVFGFIDNLKGPTLPALLREMEFSYAQGGGILFGAYLGFVIATLLTGPLADLAGNRAVLILAGVLIGVGILGFSVVSSYALLFGMMVVIGLGIGAIEVGGNALIVSIHRNAQGRYLNLLATFHGIGSLIVPLYAAWLLQAGISWRQVYQFALPLALLLALCFMLTPVPRPQKAERDGFDLATLRRNGFSPSMLWFYATIALYVSTELGIGAWLVEYLIQSKAFDLSIASLYLSGFFLAIMIGRITGSLIVERIGYLRSTLLAVIGGLVCLLIALLGPPSLAIFLPLSGFFFSIVFPTITAAVSALHPKNTGTVLGLLFAAGGIGGALGPWAIGVTSDMVGIDWGFGLTALFCAGIIFTLLVLLRRRIT
ncbi:MAG: MFS transporter [Caldilineaceae bacterium]|nr:MFS transporter [Caldilineaceae bacterium]